MEYIVTNIAEELGLYEHGLVSSTPGSAGIDLFNASLRPVTLHHAIPTVIHTGLHLWTNDDSMVTILAPRSSSEFMLTNTLGFIDSDYQGELLIRAVSRHEDLTVTLEPGQKFAQMFLAPIISPARVAFKQVDNFSSSTVRGKGGFGSTGNG